MDSSMSSRNTARNTESFRIVSSSEILKYETVATTENDSVGMLRDRGGTCQATTRQSQASVQVVQTSDILRLAQGNYQEAREAASSHRLQRCCTWHFVGGDSTPSLTKGMLILQRHLSANYGFEACKMILSA